MLMEGVFETGEPELIYVALGDISIAKGII
jgi:DNA-binding phage protein